MTRRASRVALVAAVVLACASAHAQSVESSEELEQAPPAEVLEQAPPPGAESGRVDIPVETLGPGRTIGNVVLFIPRTVMEILMLPVRGGIYLDERFRIAGHIQEWFFSSGGKVGLYPVLLFESSQGVLIGAQFQANLTRNNQFRLFAGLGPQSRRGVALELYSKNHFDGRLSLSLFGLYDRRPESRFYGIGNADQADFFPSMPVDAFDPPFAFETFYRDKLWRGAGIVDANIGGPFWISLGGLASDRERGDSNEGREIDMVFEPSTLLDFTGYRTLYGELELRYDSRAPITDWQPRMINTSGSLLLLYGGRERLDVAPSFWRYGVDAQHFFTVGSGPRVITARFQGEAVSAEPDEVPFNELPYLGGRTQLRGYALERFRDKVMGVASLEYMWDLSRLLYSSIFVDVGRVYPGLDDLTLDGLRCGFGFALEAHTHDSLLARVQVASSIDGDIWFNFYVDPVTQVQPRVRRR